MRRYDKTMSELWNLTESRNGLISEAGHMAIKTIKELEEENKQLRIALTESAEAMRKNLVYAQYKDEKILLEAYEKANKLLKP